MNDATSSLPVEEIVAPLRAKSDARKGKYLANGYLKFMQGKLKRFGRERSKSVLLNGCAQQMVKDIRTAVYARYGLGRLYYHVLQSKARKTRFWNTVAWLQMIPVRLIVWWIEFKCWSGIGHVHTIKHLYKLGIRPMKRREKYFQHCFLCERRVFGGKLG